ncbi:hypothetical protein [Dictyobacter formicarum]|uniref:VWFA domain-containing protein n=1 Tax=Dictyobacter formicarum TaxID=2778368 RepID=A0ABQ3VAI1_9CHLR|nr:hypothetical protein [Dictyobacter formicarum]GHO82701.1 hypothetical protein KSZ_07070 [Dictyobacter formicarum]
MAYALAFIRACRMNVVFVQELLNAETATGSANAGYLPKITYDQALAPCEHIEPAIEEAIKAATNPRYVLPPSALPLAFGPHIASISASLPLSHLQGFIRAGQEMKDWTAGLLAKYELALHVAQQPLPPDVTAHLEQMKSELELGDFHLRTGMDMVGQISQGKVAEALHQKTEGFLWEEMESFYRVSQLLALVITDGEADDTASFRDVVNRAAGNMYVVLAIIGHGAEHDMALRAYQQVEAQNAHVKVLPFAGETDPSVISNALFRMIE